MAIRDIPKKRGRPATGKDPLISVRLPPPLIAEIDRAASARDVSRSELIRDTLVQAFAKEG